MVKSVILFTLLVTYFGIAISSSSSHGSHADKTKSSGSSNTECRCPEMSNGFKQPFVICGKEMINKQHCKPEGHYVCRNGKVPIASYSCTDFITVTECAPYTQQQIENERNPVLKFANKIDRQCVEPMK